MVRFNWKKIERKANHDIIKIIKIMKWLTFGTVPNHSRGIEYGLSGVDFTGLSYIKNPASLYVYQQRYFTNLQMVEYMYVASLRNYAEYSITGDTSLPIEQCSLSIARVQANPLFDLKNNTIELKLENNSKWL